MAIKTTQKTHRSVFKLKTTLNKKVEGMKLADDAKFWFDVCGNRKLFLRYKENFVKVHYDHGISEFGNNRKYNFYGGYQANKNLKGGCFKIGAAYLGEKIRCDNRLRIEKFDTKFENHPEISVYHRSSYNINNNWKAQIFGAFNVSKMVLLNNAFLLGYKRNQHEFFLRG